MTKVSREEAVELLELATHWEKSCNRYVNGYCSTLRCLRRGGYEINSGPCDHAIATCEEHETAIALRAAAMEAGK